MGKRLRVSERSLLTSPLGRRLRERRTEMGLTLQQVAERVECARSYLSMIESGQRTSPPSPELIARLERALGLPAGELLALADWHKTPPAVRRQVEALEGTRRAAVAQLKELLGRGRPRTPGPDGVRTPSMVLDELWRTGRLQALVERLSGPDEHEAAGRARAGGRGAAGNNLRPSGVPVAGAEIPLINSVTAGYPRDFTDLGYPARVADSYVRSPDIQDPDAFACRVLGDSMTPDYRDGDIVIFSPARDVRSGMDCFVCLEPDHEATFKRVFFERIEDGKTVVLEPAEELDERAVTHIRLQPLNPAYPARTVGREEVAGLYAAVSVTRRLA